MKCILPGSLLRLSNPVCEGLLHPVCLLPQVLAGVGQSAANDPPQPVIDIFGDKLIHCSFFQNITEEHDFKFDKPDAGLPLLFCQTNVVVGECLPISWQTLGNIVQSFARFTLDVAPGVLQIDTTGV